ncbi:MAG TPA: carboxypeptidase-like regulatory domain-containing protein, partial [Pyrinomonadaceae bacterium]
MKINFMLKPLRALILSAAFCLVFISNITAQIERTFSGTVTTPQFELVPNVSIEIETSGGVISVTSDAEGAFSRQVPREPLSVKFFGKNIEPQTRIFAADENLENLQIKINYVVPPISESVVIEDDALAPDVERRNASVYNNTLFGRDDQLIQTLNAGINAG